MSDQTTLRNLRIDLKQLQEDDKRRHETIDGLEKAIAFYEGKIRDGALDGTSSSPAGRRLDDAIYAILSESQGPMHYREIYNELRLKGINVPGENPARNVGAHLSLDKRFFNVDKGTWRLRKVSPNPPTLVGGIKQPEASNISQLIAN